MHAYVCTCVCVYVCGCVGERVSGWVTFLTVFVCYVDACWRQTAESEEYKKAWKQGCVCWMLHGCAHQAPCLFSLKNFKKSRLALEQILRETKLSEAAAARMLAEAQRLSEEKKKH